MGCQKCSSDRLAEARAHAKDLHTVSFHGVSKEGYLASDLGIGGGDDLDITYCLDCGQIQGKWPLPQTSLERKHIGSWECDSCGQDNLNTNTECSDCGEEKEEEDEDPVSSFYWFCKAKKCNTKNDVEDNVCWKCNQKR